LIHFPVLNHTTEPLDNIMEDKPIICQIYATKEYEKFSFLPGNRKIGDAIKLKLNVESSNKLHLHPIIVNNDFQIIDGQHRWHIAKELDLYLYYIIDESYGNFDLILHNTATKLWTPQDYAIFYSNYPGKEISHETKNIYKLLIQLNTTFRFSFNFMIKCFLRSSRPENYNQNSLISSDFKKAKVMIKNNLNVENLKIYLSRVYEIIEFLFSCKIIKLKSDSLCLAVYNLVSKEDYNHSRFMDKISNNLDDLIIATRFRKTDDIYHRLLGIYNKYSKNRI
jgi:hypothetical protein